MRPSLTGTVESPGRLRRELPSARSVDCRSIALIFLAGLLGPGALRAQPQAATGETSPQQTAASDSITGAAAPSVVPLGRFVPKENLVLYVEFAGVDSHPEAWKNTAACKMLNETPLGAMLEEVASQLLDKILTFFPTHKLSGSELVALTKHAARSGWVLAINANPKGPDLSRGTFVLRGAASKTMRPLTSRLMGMMMGSEVKPKVTPKDGRTLIVVPAPAAQASSSAADAGWVWWAEKDDLIVGFLHPTSADAIIASVDGKTPSAIDHPLVQELVNPEGRFQPVGIGFAETANCPDMATGTSGFLRNLNVEHGIQRVDFRWGFDLDALMSVTRLVAPAPRKPALAVFDGTTFEKSSLLGLPDGVESFVTVSVSPSQLLEAIKQLAPDSGVSRQIDEMAESIRSAGQIDLQKDVLAYLGPRMVAYLAHGQSASTNDDSVEAGLSKGWSPTTVVAALQSVFPKLTLVAELNNPEAFDKGLAAVIIAINGELKALATEKAREEQVAAEAGDGNRRPPAAGGDRTKRRRSPRETPSPRFNLSLTPGKGKSFVLTTSKESPLQFGPSSFRPTIQLEGKYVAFAVSPDAARAALSAVQRKDWKPSAALERACDSLPAKLAALIVTDVTDSLPSLLASLPGTLQTMINTSIALAKARAGNAQTSAGPGQPGGPISGAVGADGAGRNHPGATGDPRDQFRRRFGGPGAFGPGGGFGNPAASATTTTTTGSTGDSMVVLKIDSDKLPKAADLKAYLFPSSLSIAVSNEDVKLVSRAAFPNLSMSTSLAPIAGVVASLSSLVDRLKPAAPAPAGGGPAAEAGSPAGGAGSPPAGPAGGQPGSPKRRPVGGRRGAQGDRPTPN